MQLVDMWVLVLMFKNQFEKKSIAQNNGQRLKH